jgi:hypothetical protein
MEYQEEKLFVEEIASHAELYQQCKTSTFGT